MVNLNLVDRVKFYVECLKFYILGILSAFGIGLAFGFLHEGVGVILMFLLLLYVFFKLHLRIASNLIQKKGISFMLNSLPVIITSIFWFVYKIYVNDIYNRGAGCLGKIPDDTMLVNYIGFVLWSTIFLWEVYFYIVRKIKIKGSLWMGHH